MTKGNECCLEKDKIVLNIAVDRKTTMALKFTIVALALLLILQIGIVSAVELNNECDFTGSRDCGSTIVDGNTIQLSCMDTNGDGIGACRIPTGNICYTSVTPSCFNNIQCLDSNGDGIGRCTQSTTPPTNNVQDIPVTGWFDNLNNDGLATGWAVDEDYNGAIEIHFYIDGSDPATHFVATIQANEPSPDVVAVTNLGNGNNRFSWSIPARFRDGIQHTLYAYALGKDRNGHNSNSNFHLLGSPRPFVFQTAQAPTITSYSVTPASVVEGNSITVTGNANAGSSCITAHRFYVVGSEGGAWTNVACQQSVSLNDVVPTNQNSRSFYQNPNTYTLRWEIQDQSGQTTTQDRSLTVTRAASNIGASCTTAQAALCGSTIVDGNTIQLSCMDTNGDGIGACRIPTGNLCMTNTPNSCFNNIQCLDTNGDGIGRCTQNSTTPICTSFTYSSFGQCINGIQTRTIVQSSPANCVGGNPTFTQACNSTSTTSLDTTAPGVVTNLNAIPSVTSALLSWTSPLDSDFSHVVIFATTGQNIMNATGTSVNITNLVANTTYTFLVGTSDINHNINTGLQIVTFRTLAAGAVINTSDNIPPATVTNLRVISTTSNSITWGWTNPSDADFHSVIVYFDGVNVFNTSANNFTAIGLGAGTSHTLTLNTRDLNGNINQNAVSLASSTNSGSTTSSGGNSNSRSSRGSRTGTTYFGQDDSSSNNLPIISSTDDSDAIYLSEGKAKSTFSGSKPLLWILISSCIIVLAIIGILWNRRER